MNIEKSFGAHRKNNLPHRGGGLVAGVDNGEVFVVVNMECGDGTVVEPGNHEVVVTSGIANDSVDGNEVAEDNGVVVQVFHEVADVVFVVHKLLAKLLPGTGHGLLQPWAALFECDVAGCGNFGYFLVNVDGCVLRLCKWLCGLLAAQQWAADDVVIVEVAQLMCGLECLLAAKLA